MSLRVAALADRCALAAVRFRIRPPSRPSYPIPRYPTSRSPNCSTALAAAAQPARPPQFPDHAAVQSCGRAFPARVLPFSKISRKMPVHPRFGKVQGPIPTKNASSTPLWRLKLGRDRQSGVELAFSRLILKIGRYTIALIRGKGVGRSVLGGIEVGAGRQAKRAAPTPRDSCREPSLRAISSAGNRELFARRYRAWSHRAQRRTYSRPVAFSSVATAALSG